MAANLIKAGYRVIDFDMVPAALETARIHSVTTAGTPAEAAAEASMVLTMLPSGKHLLDAYGGVNGQPGLLAVDEASALAAEEGAPLLGCPGFRRPGGAEAGTLTFMVGASSEDFETVRPILELMAKDLRLAVNALESTGVDRQMGHLAPKIYDAFAAEGGAGRDFSGIITDSRDKSGA